VVLRNSLKIAKKMLAAIGSIAACHEHPEVMVDQRRSERWVTLIQSGQTRQGKERKGKERKGKERKGKESRDQ
jgi:hypothetical protein